MGMLMRRHRQASEVQTQQETVDYENFERKDLEKVKNDDLKERLDQLEIDYDSGDTKADLINLLIGSDEELQEEQPDEEETQEETSDNEEQSQE